MFLIFICTYRAAKLRFFLKICKENHKKFTFYMILRVFFYISIMYNHTFCTFFVGKIKKMLH